MSATVAYLGRCRAKGCRHARRIELETATVTRWRMWGAERHSFEASVVVVAAEDGHRLELFDSQGYANSYAWRLAFGEHACAEHEGRMVWEPVRGTLNAEVRCDARCQNARRSGCECSCGGKNHGGRWAA